MRDRAIEPLMAIALAGLCSLGFAAHASAHITKAVGPLRVSLGWGNEPAIAGLQNFVEVGVTESSGEPVSSATLEVQVASAGARITLPVRPAEEAGSYAATLIPTRPGTYSFHLTGEARGHQIDVMATCSEATFDCVIPSSEVEFPIKDPSTAELAQRLSRQLPRAEQHGDGADQARVLAIAALGLAAVAVAIALRGRRKS